MRFEDSLAKRLNTFRKNRELCDVVLFVNEREILAHKAVLAAVSSALFEMFKGETATSEEQNDLTPRASGFGAFVLFPSFPADASINFSLNQNCRYPRCLGVRNVHPPPLSLLMLTPYTDMDDMNPDRSPRVAVQSYVSDSGSSDD